MFYLHLSLLVNRSTIVGSLPHVIDKVTCYQMIMFRLARVQIPWRNCSIQILRKKLKD